MRKYDNFFLPTTDMEECKKFYANILGLDVKFDFSDKGMVAYSVGDEEPAIILKDKNKYPNTKPTIWFEVDNVQTYYQKLKSKGVSFLSEPFKIKTGWAVEFLDPAGNQLGITDYNE